MAGMVRNIKWSGLSRRDAIKMYAEIELVYRGEEEGVGVDTNQGTGPEETSQVAPQTPAKKKTMRTMLVRKTLPRDTKSSHPSPKRHAGIRRDQGTASKGEIKKHEDSVG